MIQTLAFFSQKKAAPPPLPSWHGDWAFRRWRLEELNSAFFEIKPDLLIAQEVMRRAESPYESDQAILSSSSLSGYNWSVAPIEKDLLTQEEESAALAFSYPFQFMPKEIKPVVWKIEDGYVTAFALEFQNEPVAIVSWFQNQSTEGGHSLKKLLPLIQEFLLENKICSSRLLIAGVFAQAVYDSTYQNFLHTLQLRDTADGFCEQESQCYTHTPTNKMYDLLFTDSVPKRAVRILVPQKALIANSRRNFAQPGVPRSYNARYGLSETWGSLYAGWLTEIHLPQCTN